MGGLLSKIHIPSGAVNAHVDSRLTRGACQADVRTQALGVAPGGVVARGLEQGAVVVTGMETGAVRIVNQGEGVLVALVAALAIVVLGEVELVVAVTVLGAIALVGAISYMKREKGYFCEEARKDDEKKPEKELKFKHDIVEPVEEDILVTDLLGEHEIKQVTNIEACRDTPSESIIEDSRDAPSECVIIGSSVAQAALADMPYCVAATLTITNKTQLNLKDDKTFVTSGHVKVPAREIHANHSESMAMHKSIGTATGSYGVTSFVLGEEEAKLVILWGVAYNQNHRSNWLGLVVVPGYINIEENAFNRMWNQQFYGNALKDFYYDTNKVSFMQDMWRVEGTMGTAHKTEIRVTIYQE